MTVPAQPSIIPVKTPFIRGHVHRCQGLGCDGLGVCFTGALLWISTATSNKRIGPKTSLQTAFDLCLCGQVTRLDIQLRRLLVQLQALGFLPAGDWQRAQSCTSAPWDRRKAVTCLGGMARPWLAGGGTTQNLQISCPFLF